MGRLIHFHVTLDNNLNSVRRTESHHDERRFMVRCHRQFFGLGKRDLSKIRVNEAMRLVHIRSNLTQVVVRCGYEL